MDNDPQIKGMLLEEIILKALETAGYDTVTEPDGKFLHKGPAGLEIRGRGTLHQIDAIADYSLQQPFSHPQRLLVEGKCHTKNIRLPMVRCAVGVLKDVVEFWNSEHFGLQRYHYQYAVFSASNFSPRAQQYAFAQDIYLFPLSNSKFFRPILRAIRRTRTRGLEAQRQNETISMQELRLAFRSALQNLVSGKTQLDDLLRKGGCEGVLDMVLAAAAGLKGVLFASTQSGFLVLLVPSPDRTPLKDLIDEGTSAPIAIRVKGSGKSRIWFIESSQRKNLFTLDIPPELFRLYTGGGSLDRRARQKIKDQEFATFVVPYRIDGKAGLARFALEPGWVDLVEQSLPQESSAE